MRSIRPLVALVLLVPALLPAQQDSAGRRLDGTAREGHRSALVHYGKWVAAAGTATLIALGGHEHGSSNRGWNALLAVCGANNADCVLAPAGPSATPAAGQWTQPSPSSHRR